MASNIDPAVPPFGNPTTAGVRGNFQTAKNEIQALQSMVPWADYNDTLTSGSPISMTANTWTKLTNDSAGSNTTEAFLTPSGISTLWDQSTSQFDFTDVPAGSHVIVRFDYNVTTSSANQVVQTRLSAAIGGAGPFQIPGPRESFKTAGTYRMSGNIIMTIRGSDSQTFPAQMEAWSDGSATAVVAGWQVSVLKWLL